MSGKMILYSSEYSPGVRVVKIVAKLLGLELEIRDVDFLHREHLKESYIKLNPEHTVPTLVDTDGFVIWESHAICAYLVDKYAKDDSLYPKDLQLRARCNQRLFFESVRMFVRLRECFKYIIFYGGKEVPQDKVNHIYEAYDILEAFLVTDPFLVGDRLTIADISVATTSVAIEVYAPLQNDKYPKIFAWLKRVKEAIPVFDEINSSNFEFYRNTIQGAMEKNKQSQVDITSVEIKF